MSELEQDVSSIVPSTSTDLQPESASQWPSSSTLAQRKVLGAVSVGLSLTRSATLAGVSMPTVQRWRRDGDESFRDALDDARERGTQYLEDAALERATDMERPSDALLMFLLKARRPEVYRERLDVRASGRVERVKRIILQGEVREAMARDVEALQSDGGTPLLEGGEALQRGHDGAVAGGGTPRTADITNIDTSMHGSSPLHSEND